MKRKLKLTGLAAAAIMTISAVAIPVQAANSASDNPCLHPTLVRVEKNKTINYATQKYHIIYVDYEYRCGNCDTVRYTGSDAYQEEHDYCIYNPSTGKFACACGDSY